MTAHSEIDCRRSLPESGRCEFTERISESIRWLVAQDGPVVHTVASPYGRLQPAKFSTDRLAVLVEGLIKILIHQNIKPYH